MPRNNLIKKLWLLSKLLTSKWGNKQLQHTYYPKSQEVKAITMTFGQLIRYSVENIFLQKS